MSVTCSENAKKECIYYRYAQGSGDASDILSLLIAYIVLWINPEKMLFPAGIILYVIPCIVGTIKFWKRTASFLKNVIRAIDLVAVTLLGIAALLGINGQLTCSIIDDVNLISLGASLHSLIPIPDFSTVILLSIAGIPLATASIKYFLPRGNSTAKKQTGNKATSIGQ